MYPNILIVQMKKLRPREVTVGHERGHFQSLLSPTLNEALTASCPHVAPGWLPGTPGKVWTDFTQHLGEHSSPSPGSISHGTVRHGRAHDRCRPNHKDWSGWACDPNRTHESLFLGFFIWVVPELLGPEKHVSLPVNRRLFEIGENETTLLRREKIQGEVADRQIER